MTALHPNSIVRATQATEIPATANWPRRFTRFVPCNGGNRCTAAVRQGAAAVSKGRRAAARQRTRESRTGRQKDHRGPIHSPHNLFIEILTFNEDTLGILPSHQHISAGTNPPDIAASLQSNGARKQAARMPEGCNGRCHKKPCTTAADRFAKR